MGTNSVLRGTRWGQTVFQGVLGGDKQCSKGYRVGTNSIPRGTEWGQTVFQGVIGGDKQCSKGY